MQQLTCSEPQHTKHAKRVDVSAVVPLVRVPLSSAHRGSHLPLLATICTIITAGTLVYSSPRNINLVAYCIAHQGGLSPGAHHGANFLRRPSTGNSVYYSSRHITVAPLWSPFSEFMFQIHAYSANWLRWTSEVPHRPYLISFVLVGHECRPDSISLFPLVHVPPELLAPNMTRY